MYVEARQQHSCGSGRAAAAPQQKKKKRVEKTRKMKRKGTWKFKGYSEVRNKKKKEER